MLPQPNQTIERVHVNKVGLHALFFEISEELGYSLERIEEQNYLTALENLITLWEEQGYIEVYSEKRDRQYGRIKCSDSAPNSVPWYIDLHHARLLRTGENDPLVTVVFEKFDEFGEPCAIASLRFLTNHDLMFGEDDPKIKSNAAYMKEIRKRIDALIQEGNRFSEEQRQLNREKREAHNK